MGTLFKIFAVSNALAMALPFGWCCPSPAAAESETASAPCPRCQPQQSPDDQSAPAAPDSPEKCPCCQVRATQTGAPISTAPAAEGWTALAAAIVSESPSAHDFEPAQFIRPPGPSLQILHCVWRC